MINKILILFFALLLTSCGGSKITTTKGKKYSKTYPTSKKTVTKPTPVAKSPAKENPSGSEILVATSKVKATTEDVKKYIEDFKETAKNNMKVHGIPASITMAQGILESGAGFGSLAKEANNHFGIKCHTGWTGESVKYDDDAEQECFRK
uniref:glucosaminidase domain-containing protein n=1 Tax=Flavobacterium sp. TaxID=239 RepID=UPI00333FD29F